MSNGSRISIEEMNSEGFVKRAKSLDGLAFDQLCECIINPIVRFVHHQYEILEADAEEIAADTLMKVRKNLPRFDVNGGAKLSTWIFRIAINGTKDFLRQQKALKSNLKIVELDKPLGELHASQATAAAWAKEETEAEMPDEAVLMLKAFESLSIEHQDILRQKHCMTYKDIADIEGVTEGALRVRHNRAVKRLKAAYEKETCDE
jgi:RNA polymerase sigma factor (sigma-70 family)